MIPPTLAPDVAKSPFRPIIAWRGILLGLLYLLPPVVYFCLGAWWLFEHGLLIYGVVGWISFTLLFAWLSRRWMKDGIKVLPPLDWEKPWTFAPRDADAWKIIQETADRAADLTLDQLTRLDTYQQTTEELAMRVAACYYPGVPNPLDKLPIVELIVAIELAAEDLEGLCRQVPAMDQLTPGHLKGLSKAVGYAQTANDLYSFALPVFRPVTGLPRLLVQKLVAEPAWKQTKEGLQRWLFRAYVNRLGVHLVELSSGRLRSGSAAYRHTKERLTPEAQQSQAEPVSSSSANAARRSLAVIALIPGLEAKPRRERFGTWRHLAETAHDPIADALNLSHRGLEGVRYLDDLTWNLAEWPALANEFLSDENEERWSKAAADFLKADVVVADLRDMAAMHQLGQAQELLDWLTKAYSEQTDWPVAPVLILTDAIDTRELHVHEHMQREVRFRTVAGLDSSKDPVADTHHGFDPEVETMADVASLLPLARQRSAARNLAAEARQSGLRRAAGQVAEAAGRAGWELVSGWLSRKKASSSETSAAERTSTDEPPNPS